ncbi:MAG: carboxypeptidase regulatory-like domain-containing protein, partial [Clostridia bacterium]|nr:carboxypeptidase regulatory-like domain-containing protein [Clostridia bacterium]
PGNYSVSTESGELTMTAASAAITITAGSGSWTYDGSAHTNNEVTVTDGELFEGDRLVAETTGSVKNVADTEDGNNGITPGYKIMHGDVDVTENYVITPAAGTLTVTALSGVEVTITGHNDTVDYDGEVHTVTGYDAVAASPLYDVTKAFTFSGTAEVSGTDAGTTEMGLSAEQFENVDPNFANVTFKVTDGYITVSPIGVTVTITGHNDSFDYDGKSHTVTGYDAASSTSLYDVTSDFAFSGKDKAVRTNAGTTAMGLTPGQFRNTNGNFANVIFRVTDGFVTVNPVDAVITKAPTSADPIYDGSALALINAGEATGGTLYYAAVTDPDGAPDDGSYSTAIPTATETGRYFVWYKVAGDGSHNDLAPDRLIVILSEDDWVTLSGTLYKNDGTTPLEGAVVSIKSGNQTVDSVRTDKDGNYEFKVPSGVYSVVSELEDVTHTTIVSLYEDTTQDVVLPDANTTSLLEVSADDDNACGIAVGGLDEEAKSIREAEQISPEKNVSVLMKVDVKTSDTAVNAGPILAAGEKQYLDFFDVSIERTVDSVTTVIGTTTNVLEIAVPYTNTAKRGISVYCSDGFDLQTFTENDSREAGTFRIDRENGVVYIYTNSFATFAIGYTPYFNMTSDMSLGSFKGVATVIIRGVDDDSEYKLEDVSLDDVSFADIPKGQYTMTITWIDGAENTLTVPLTIGKERAARSIVAAPVDVFAQSTSVLSVGPVVTTKDVTCPERSYDNFGTIINAESFLLDASVYIDPAPALEPDPDKFDLLLQGSRTMPLRI